MALADVARRQGGCAARLLRREAQVKPEVQLLPAVEAMHAVMGSVAEGALPAQVDALVQATGVGCMSSLYV